MTDFSSLEGDTIAAISTPPGEGGIGIVRLSGPEAVAIAEKLFHSPKGARPGGSHRVRHGFVRDPETGEDVDEVLLTVMRAPRTYTREDVAEINCHGGAVPLGRVLELALACGARLAAPGEFTRRAFLNGRIDLTQAEAAIDLIRASTETAERLALEQLRGGLSLRINSFRDRLLEMCAHVEAYIDFPEDEIEPRALGELAGGMGALRRDIEALSETYREGRFFREGLRTAIVGKPNVGKSSLLNALLRRDRAIVAELPGTTRDTIEERLNIEGLPLKVIDTAGIRQAHDMVEGEGVRRSLQALEDADLVLAVIDAHLPLEDEDLTVLRKVSGRRAVIVLNKTDLGSEAEVGPLAGDAPMVGVSAKTGDGLDALKEEIFRLAVGAPGRLSEGVMVTNLRHSTALREAARSLGAALSSIQRPAPLEIVAMELRDALDRLGEIVGAVTTEDILDRIFSDFCIGK